MDEIERIERELEGATTMVATARRILADGRGIDLAGLDGRVGQICERVRRLPEPAGHRFRPRLLALLDEVDRLGTDLEAQRAVVSRALADLATRKQAVVAYGRGTTRK
jgi:hypothetical protein